MEIVQRPKVLFIGNGIYYNGNYKWKEVIKRYVDNPSFSDMSDKVPNTIKVLPADMKARKHKARMEDAFKDYPYNSNSDFMSFLKLSSFDTIITSNYTYDIENDLDDKFLRIKDKRAKYSRSTAKRRDKKYLVKTYNLIEGCFDEKRTIKIWHMHGELRNSDSIILSHDAYGGLVGKITNYISSKYTNKQDKVEYDSWIDYLLYADVFFVGFGLDYSEFDLWWLINKRMKTPNHGEMYFYHPITDDVIEERLKLLQCFDINVNSLGYKKETIDYNKFYNEVYKDIITVCNDKKNTLANSAFLLPNGEKHED